MIRKYIAEMLSYENPKEGVYTGDMPIADAIDILERFEVEFLNELTCEKLLKLQDATKGLSKVERTIS